MLQDAGAGLTKLIPQDATNIVLLLGGLYWLGSQVYTLIKRGRRGQRDDLQREIDTAVEKYKTAATEFEVVAKSRKERIDELARELKDAQDEAAGLRTEMEQRRKITDRLQREVMELQGTVDRLEGQIEGLKRG